MTSQSPTMTGLGSLRVFCRRLWHMLAVVFGSRPLKCRMSTYGHLKPWHRDFITCCKQPHTRTPPPYTA